MECSKVAKIFYFIKYEACLRELLHLETMIALGIHYYFYKAHICRKLSRKDRLIQTFEEHEDSVYSISWATSAWIFASLSYEGRVVVSHVPTEYSDAILLDDTFE